MATAAGNSDSGGIWIADCYHTLTMISLRHPIGVFDSGVGGLTVLRALRRKLPGRDFIYVGDTARVPYGRKPKEMVETFASGITEFLIGQGVEAVVIACNTASAASLPQLAARVPVPVWGVIEPGVGAARRLSRTGRVGVIATKGTIASGV
jgi:glutamate racemase